MSAVRQESVGNNAIRPFRVNVAESELAELRRRIVQARLPEKETVADKSQGVPLATVKELARYWATQYDWRKVEARLNSYPQFITEIDGLDIHFIHVRSKHPNALPLLISHGWPSSITEKLKIVDALTDPTAHGGSAADAFDVVIPSMPGYGFSGKPTTTGWDPARIGRAWAELMNRLGYKRYVAQGGDWGAIVVDQMGVQSPQGLVAIHTHMPGTVPADIDQAAFTGSPAPAGLAADEALAYDMLVRAYKSVHYAFYMGSRPQTLTGLTDSPIGLATFLLDPGPRSLDLSGAFDGSADASTHLTRDDVLDTVTLFWLTNTAVSAGRLYWENKVAYFSPKGVAIPVAVSVFPDEIYQAPRSWAERAYPKLIHYNKLEKGGHFPAWEQPQLLAQELRTGLRSLRQA